MADQDRFEARLAAALDRYADEAPRRRGLDALADEVTARPQRRGILARLTDSGSITAPGFAQLRPGLGLAWLLLAGALLATAIGLALIGGLLRSDELSVAPSPPVVPTEPAPAVDPIASRIAFLTNDGGDPLPFGLATIGADGQYQTELIRISGNMDFQWSPDGRWIALLAELAPGVDVDGASVEPLAHGVYTMRSDGSDLALVSLVEPRTGRHLIAWAPDGTAISHTAGSAFEVSDDVSVGLGASTAFSPAWSPDGSRLALVRAGPGQAGGPLAVVERDGTGLRDLTQSYLSTQGHDYTVVWTPDGRRILFSHNAGDATGPHDAIDIIEADGTGQRRIADGTRFAMSPDGRTVAVPRADGLHLVDIDGVGEPTRLDVGGAVLGELSWSPDGRRIAFALEDGIHVINADGTGRQWLAEGRDPVWSPVPAQMDGPADPSPPAPELADGWALVTGDRPGDTPDGWSQFASDGTSFVAIDDQNALPGLWRSDDGITWERTDRVPGAGRFTGAPRVHAAAGGYVLGYLCERQTACHAWRSLNGVDWSAAEVPWDSSDAFEEWRVAKTETLLATDPPGMGWGGSPMSVVLEFNDRVVVYGWGWDRDQQDRRPTTAPVSELDGFDDFAAVESRDGTTWTPLEPMPPFASIIDVRAGEGTWWGPWRCGFAVRGSTALAVLPADDGLRGWTSDDGLAWEEVELDLPDDDRMLLPRRGERSGSPTWGACLTALSDGWAIHPDSTDARATDVWLSTDGATWERLSVPDGFADHTGRIQIAGDTLFLSGDGRSPGEMDGMIVGPLRP